MKQLSCSPVKRGGKKLAAFGLAATVAGGALLSVPAAHAASGTVPTFWGAQYGQTVELNTEWNDSRHGGENTAGPGNATNWVGAVATKGYINGTSANKGYTWCIQWSEDANGSELRDPSRTSTISGEKARTANIIVAKYAGNGSNHPEIAMAMHDLFDTKSADGRNGENAWTFEKRMNKNSKFNSILSDAQGWIDSAEKYSKPYKIQPEFDFGNESPTVGSTGKITNLNVLSGTTSLGQGVGSVGNQIRITVELSGGAEFTSGHKTKQTFNPGETPSIKLTKAGMIGATVETNNSLPNNAVTKLEFNNWQDRVTHQAPTSISGAVPGMQVMHMPSVTTETSEAKAEPGAELFDKITVTGVPEGQDVTVSSTLYYAGSERPTRQATVPSTAEAVGTVETVVNGSGTYETPTITIDKSGYYVWVETIEGTDTMRPWTSDYGISEETSLIPWSPEVTTQTSDARALPGTVLTDKLTVTGVPEDRDVIVESSLYFAGEEKPERGADIPEHAELVGTVQTTVNGEGDYVTPGIEVEKSGYHVWVETIKPTEDINEWTSDYGISEETSLVPWIPEVTTQTSHARAEAGTELTDKISVTGVPSNEEVTVTSTLYYNGDERPERTENIPEHAEAVGSVETIVKGEGDYETPGIVIDTPGYYTWVETIEPSEKLEPWTSDYGISEETSIVPWSPKVATKTSEQRAEPGAEIHDVLMISDNKDGKELTVESTLYGPFDHREEQGTELPEDAPVVGTVSTVIEGNGEFKTESLEIEERGYYFWVETIDETDETEPWGYEEDESPTWQEDETTVVPWDILSSSEISDRSSHKGGVVHDTVWTAGYPWDHAVDRGELFMMAPPMNQPQADGNYILPITEDGANLDASDTAEMQLTMYGPFDTMPERSDDIPEDAPVHDVVNVPAVNGQVLSADFKKFDEAGYYTIVTSFDGSDRVNPYTSEFGIPSESTYVPHPDVPGEPVPDDPAEKVDPKAPKGVKTPDQVKIDTGNPVTDNAGLLAGAGAGIALIGLGGYLAYRRKNATGLES